MQLQHRRNRSIWQRTELVRDHRKSIFCQMCNIGKIYNLEHVVIVQSLRLVQDVKNNLCKLLFVKPCHTKSPLRYKDNSYSLNNNMLAFF